MEENSLYYRETLAIGNKVKKEVEEGYYSNEITRETMNDIMWFHGIDTSKIVLHMHADDPPTHNK